jgi:hypothetical protein
VRDRARRGDHKARDDGQDGRERRCAEQRQRDRAAGRPLTAAERLSQQRRGQVAAGADGLRRALPEHGARAEADDRHQRRERRDDADRVQHRRPRGLRVRHGEEPHQDVRQAGGADEDRQAGRDDQQR